MAKAVRGIAAARRATVRVCNRAGNHRGQGLLLGLEEEGTVVLTCHHVIAPLERDDLYVPIALADGQLGSLLPAKYDERRSRPHMDAVVPRVDGVQDRDTPLLHALNPGSYVGSLPVIGLTYLEPDNFTAS